MVRTVFKTAEAFARGLLGSIPRLSRHPVSEAESIGFCAADAYGMLAVVCIVPVHPAVGALGSPLTRLRLLAPDLTNAMH